jgi:uncharacterized protein
MTTLAPSETTELIAGKVGKLETIVTTPTTDERNAWGIVCHPHPLYGGNMHNKVVTTLVRAFQGLGVTTVRFNFRGVGQSDGEFDNGCGEQEDLLAVMAWAQQQFNKKEIWLAGFSFGAYIAASVASQVPVNQLVLVAPPVQHFAMQTLTPLINAWILAQGEADDVVPAADVFAWAESRNPKPTILRFPNVGHFFHGELSTLRSRVQEALVANGGY